MFDQTGNSRTINNPKIYIVIATDNSIEKYFEETGTNYCCISTEDCNTTIYDYVQASSHIDNNTPVPISLYDMEESEIIIYPDYSKINIEILRDNLVQRTISQKKIQKFYYRKCFRYPKTFVNLRFDGKYNVRRNRKRS